MHATEHQTYVSHEGYGVLLNEDSSELLKTHFLWRLQLHAEEACCGNGRCSLEVVLQGLPVRSSFKHSPHYRLFLEELVYVGMASFLLSETEKELRRSRL